MSKFFGGLFGNSSRPSEEVLKAPFVLNFNKETFCEIKIETLYKKILHRCYARSAGAKDDKKIASLFDSKEKSGSPSGLITLLAQSMAKKQEVGIVYDSGVVRLATFTEKQKIKKDYISGAQSADGVLVDFTKYCLTDLVSGYMGMIYDILDSMNVQVGLAKALQIKVSNLRGTVSSVGQDEPVAQAKAINESLKGGNSVLLDKNDEVDLLTLNSSAVAEAISLVNSQLATDIGMSLSFVNGELTSGMSATGEADSNQDEEGVKDFFNSIFKATTDRLYDWKLRFVSDDWRYFSAMIDSLIVVENSGLLSDDQKKAFADRLMPINAK
jgi:hypothetical protein